MVQMVVNLKGMRTESGDLLLSVPGASVPSVLKDVIIVNICVKSEVNGEG